MSIRVKGDSARSEPSVIAITSVIHPVCHLVYHMCIPSLLRSTAELVRSHASTLYYKLVCSLVDSIELLEEVCNIILHIDKKVRTSVRACVRMGC